MKLVIDISEKSYERIKYMYIRNNSTASDFRNIIMEGTPLEKVLEDIEEELKELITTRESNKPMIQNCGVYKALEIIDSHIRGKDQE